MSKVFKTVVELENYVESACTKAVENACNRLLGTLQELIDTVALMIFGGQHQQEC